MFDLPLEIWRPKSVPDGAGGRTKGVPALVATFNGKVDQPSSEVAGERVTASQAAAELLTPIYFEGVVDVRRGDEIRDTCGKNRYRVISRVRPSTPVYTKAFCEILQEEGS